MDVSPDLEKILTIGAKTIPRYSPEQIGRETVFVEIRDGIHLATDLYLPPNLPAPAVAIRTPYGRKKVVPEELLTRFAQHGYVALSQDCRGTGDSEPDVWDYYVYEREDSMDFVDWVSRQQWFDGFLGAFGGSYNAQTQFCMAMHPRMSAIVPEVGGLGIAFHAAHYYMFLNAISRTVGKGEDKIPIGYDEMERQMEKETLAGGYFNEPLNKPFSNELLQRYPYLKRLRPPEAKRWLWENYSALPPKERAEMIRMAFGKKSVASTDIESASTIFGQEIAHDAHMFPSPRVSILLESLYAPILFVTGWYDWGVDDALITWEYLSQDAPEPIRSRSRIIIAPSAHNKPGYHVGRESHPELDRNFRTADIQDLLLKWYETVREGSFDSWPQVTYYLMGANEWYTAPTWPPLEARTHRLYLGPNNSLSSVELTKDSAPDKYVYDPIDPTPTVGGSIVSYVVTPGSVDVNQVQKRSDVLVYSTEVLSADLDVVGPLRLTLFASSTARDTDFCARLSDVFSDGRAIQIQSGFLRARYRNPAEPELLEPGRIYEFEIDMWATANRFKAGHRLRLDISSADFPRFDRNANLAGEEGSTVRATQTIYHDLAHPSHLKLSVIG